MNSNKGLPNYTYVEFRRFWTETKAWTIRLKYSFQTMLDQFLGNVTGNMSKEWYNLGGSNNNNAKIGRLICILYTVASVQVMQNCLFQGHINFFSPTIEALRNVLMAIPNRVSGKDFI